MTTTKNTPTQPLNNPTPQSGSGSGSGASTTVHVSASKEGVKPLVSSGSSGSGGGGSVSSGSVFPTGSAIVTGKVWLDNNGDGVEDDGESGLGGSPFN